MAHQFLIAAHPQSEVRIRNADGDFCNIPIDVREAYFYPPEAKAPKSSRKKKSEKSSDKQATLVIGFDTEYVLGDGDLSREGLKAGQGKNQPLSYQVYCRLNDAESPHNGVEWGGVFYPVVDDERFTLDELISFAVSRGVALNHVDRVPRKIELVGHFSRADMPMLENIDQLTPFLQAVRGVFVTGRPVPLRYELPTGTLDLKVSIRDTYLLTAEGAKRLEDLGEVVGVPKIKLADTPQEETRIKSRMDLLLRSDPDLFEKYALADAIICVRYHERIRDLCNETIRSQKVPLTLSGIGVKRLQLMWKLDKSIDPHQVLGVEVVKDNTFDRETGRVYRNDRVVDRERVNLRRTLAIEAYHGGRGEQFWFGPGPVESPPVDWILRRTPVPTPAKVEAPMVWNDFDLSSAYPTAMSLIGYPDWNNMNLHPKLVDFTPTTLGVALVDFEFPEAVRYPCMPVRTEHGIVFPRRGRSYCTAPEITLALELGARVEIIDGAVVPMLNEDIRPFGAFVTDAIKRRKEHKKGSLENRFWKELVNSLYGKLAQGLRSKRVFDVSDKSMKDLGPSEITNPYFAAFVTGYVRALLAEIMNALPASVHVFSCTTDGFLSTATQVEIDAACSGTLAAAYRSSRVAIAGSDDVVELKHQTGRLLGWRARGQATLTAGAPKDGDPSFHYVLAKAGIRAPASCETLAEQNDYIVDLFLRRTPATKVEIKSLTGIRDIVIDKNDLVPKTYDRRLSMEYDFKRRPDAIGSSLVGNHHHVSWSTVPWDTVEQFNIVRDELDLHRSPKRSKGSSADDADNATGCLKYEQDYINFAMRVALKASDGDTRYVQAQNPDIKLLRRALCSARHFGEAGLDKATDGLTAREFASVLAGAGVPCKRSDVENGKKYAFTPNSVTSSRPVMAAIEKLQRVLPDIRPADLLTESKLDLLGDLGSLSTNGRRIGLRLWKYPKIA